MDIQFLLFLQNLRELTGGYLNNFFTFITTISVDQWVVVPSLIVFWVVDKKKGLIMLFSNGISRYFVGLAKSLACVYRPWIRNPEIKPLQEVVAGATGYSFPSGHSVSAASFYGALIRIFHKNRGICIFCGFMIFLTMLSRNFLGVHTPQDVVVGCALGLLAALLGEKLLDWIDAHPDKDWIVLIVTIIVSAIVLIIIRYKQYPMDYVNGELLVDPKKMTVDGFKDIGLGFGLIVGWYIERHFVKFSTEGTVEHKILRSMIGALAYTFILTAIVNPLGKSIGIDFVHFTLQACESIFFMTVYPIIFTAAERKALFKKNNDY